MDSKNLIRPTWPNHVSSMQHHGRLLRNLLVLNVDEEMRLSSSYVQQPSKKGTNSRAFKKLSTVSLYDSNILIYLKNR